MEARKDKVYNPSYDQWTMVELGTELEPNRRILTSVVEVDFNKCFVRTRDRKKIHFDGLSESQFIHVCNGGYYEDAPAINDSDRV